MNELLEQLKYWRAERPDEWKMDEFLWLAEEQNRRIAELENHKSYYQDFLKENTDCESITELVGKYKKQSQRIAELEQENKGLSVALSMPTSVDALTTEAFALEQQAKGVQRLVDNWFDMNILDSEDIEVVSAVRFINELRKQAAKLKGQK